MTRAELSKQFWVAKGGKSFKGWIEAAERLTESQYAKLEADFEVFLAKVGYDGSSDKG